MCLLLYSYYGHNDDLLKFNPVSGVADQLFISTHSNQDHLQKKQLDVRNGQTLGFTHTKSDVLSLYLASHFVYLK